MNARYREVWTVLREEILQGRYAASGAFPSSVQLARRFNTTRATIRRALDQLRHDGLIGSRQGAGTFVTRRGASRRIGLIVPGITYSEGNLGVRSAGAKRGSDVWYLGGVKTLYGTKESPIDLGFVDIPKVEKKTKRRYVWKKGDFNLKPNARLSAEMPQFRPIPWDKIGLYNDDWRTILPE